MKRRQEIQHDTESENLFCFVIVCTDYGIGGVGDGDDDVGDYDYENGDMQNKNITEILLPNAMLC